MKGIILVTQQRKKGSNEIKETIDYQLFCIKRHINLKNVELAKLNPFQLNDYYTILHALAYDLKTKDVYLDILLIYSLETIYDFIEVYPEYWLEIKNHFSTMYIAKNNYENPFKLRIKENY